MKLTVSITRSSDLGQAGCALELELADPRGTGRLAAEADRQKNRTEIRRAFALCTAAVDDQLARMADAPPADREPGSDDVPTSAATDRGGGWYQPPGTDRGAPRNGRALFAWVKDQGRRHGIDLLGYLNGWARLQEFPARMIDWDGPQVADAHAEAVRKLADVPEEARS